MATDSSAPTTPVSESTTKLEGRGDDAPASPSTSLAAGSPSPSQKGDAPRQGNHIAIPPIAPIASHESPARLARGLEGRFVDEFGNVLGWDGTVLGRVQGDLPAMVGRAVSPGGEVLDEEGQVAGYVCESFVAPAESAAKPQQQQQSCGARRELDRGLRVDDAGTIYNQEGAAVGKMTTAHQNPSSSRPGESRPPDQGSAHAGGHPPAPSAASPSPSEVFLDVKSTHDGIQLIIKIPTVFHPGRESSGAS
ncbi:hypothetical protein HIM_02455 [Hirsutella minnesotensis 3608]|nr:hypothetical protein HIM_02455 [Hirsutella minnesotensis 3608]